MIQLTDEMRKYVNNALDDGVPMIAASVGEDRQPTLSFYGSTHVHSDDQLAIWIRNPNGGLVGRIPANPHMAFMYRNPGERVAWQFHGRARVVDDGDEARRVYDESPELERSRDPERNGLAVVVDLDRVIARGEILMER